MVELDKMRGSGQGESEEDAERVSLSLYVTDGAVAQENLKRGVSE